MTMILLRLFCVLLAVCCVWCKSPYKICVAEQYLKDCQDMLQVDTQSKTQLQCVAARDRMECLNFVQQRQADFVPADPEDMYVASKIPNQDFVVFQEYRTEDEPDAEFRYEAVIVVHKDLKINNLDQLKGLKSCHTGVNRNVGYKIPLTMMMKRSVFPKMNDQTISPKENELKALSTFFKKSCIVGKWSPDPKINSAWKARYSQLCALCEDPAKCDYPDNYSGYEGALRCLSHNGGEVAFTKVIYVRKFFGLPVGTIPASTSTENPDNFSYLCVDGSKKAIRDKACTWAARPWQGLLGHNDILADMSPLREKIRQLAVAGASQQQKPDWFTKVLGLSDKIYHVSDNVPIKPADYLDKANYTDVIERGHGPPEPVVRLCVTSNTARAKCEAMSVFAFSRDIRPRLQCVQQPNDDACLLAVQNNEADLAAAQGLTAPEVARRYNLHPVLHEVYGKNKTALYAVAVVRKDATFSKIDELRGKRSCHNSYGSFSGLNAPVYYLIHKGLIKSEANKCVNNMANFFSGGLCLPDVDKPEYNPLGTSTTNLKSQCTSASDTSPLSCMEAGRADVAFVSSEDLSKYDPSKYQLLCLNRDAGGRESLDKYETCHVALEPLRTWLSSKDLIADVSVTHTPLSLAQLLEQKTELFNIYGEFMNNDNVIFNNAATSLAPTELVDFQKIKTINDVISNCQIA